jgi:FtsP/CotA-like multicopper oxidase with cupredoxin domain
VQVPSFLAAAPLGMIQTMNTNRFLVEVREPDPSGAAPIPVGGTFTYQLQFPGAGFCWHHPHIREDFGLGG